MPLTPGCAMDAAPPGARNSISVSERVSQWRAGIVVGLVLASGLLAASVMGLSRNLLDRRAQATRNTYDCRLVRDSISEWGERLAFEAATLGSLMQGEQQKTRNSDEESDHYHHAEAHLPFLVPGELTLEQQSIRLERMSTEFKNHPPAMGWCPTVHHADREAFEAYAEDLYDHEALFGRPILIHDEYWSTNGPATPKPSPPRASYNPVSTLWVLPDPDAVFPLERLAADIGRDWQEMQRTVLPAALAQRFFEDRRIVARPFYGSNGEPYTDFVITAFVPFVDGDAAILGYVVFALHVDHWDATFPNNVRISMNSNGDVIKTQQSGYVRNAKAYEPVLDLDLVCYFKDDFDTNMLFIMGTTASAAFILLGLAALHRLEAGASKERKAAYDQRTAAAAAEERKDERTRDAFQSSEKTERYLNHELKNRIFVLGQSYSDETLVGQLDEITEVLNSKTVLMRLSTGRYEPTMDAFQPVSLIAVRWKRFVAANSPFERAATTGAAAHRTVLLFDKVLFNIIMDNMLSNAFKYGDPSRPPALSLNVEPLDDGATRVRLSLELRNWAGPEHASLVQMGEDELNEIALAEGRRAHVHAAELSAGDGFSMAGVAARTLGGTIRLVLLPDGVVAKLELPNVVVAELPDVVVAPCPGEARILVETARQLSRLKVAMVDDSASFRKTFARLAETVTSRVPFVAGATRESIDDFPKSVVESDVDIVFLDFNYAPVHHTKTGIDLCRECRERDAEEGNAPRLIFIVSANDSPEDAERYRAAGADGSLGKKITVAKLREILDAARDHPRFAAGLREKETTPPVRGARALGPWSALGRSVTNSRSLPLINRSRTL